MAPPRGRRAFPFEYLGNPNIPLTPWRDPVFWSIPPLPKYASQNQLHRPLTSPSPPEPPPASRLPTPPPPPDRPPPEISSSSSSSQPRDSTSEQEPRGLTGESASPRWLSGESAEETLPLPVDPWFDGADPWAAAISEGQRTTEEQTPGIHVANQAQAKPGGNQTFYPASRICGKGSGRSFRRRSDSRQPWRSCDEVTMPVDASVASHAAWARGCSSSSTQSGASWRVPSGIGGSHNTPASDDIAGKVEEFLMANNIDARAAEVFRQMPPALAEKVLSGGSLVGTRNPSAAILGRIRGARGDRVEKNTLIQVCSVHKKRREVTFLCGDGRGGFRCVADHQCIHKGFCCLHNKPRKKAYLESNGDGGFHCVPGFPCIRESCRAGETKVCQEALGFEAATCLAIVPYVREALLPTDETSQLEDTTQEKSSRLADFDRKLQDTLAVFDLGTAPHALCQEVGDSIHEEKSALCQEVGDTIDEKDTAAVFELRTSPYELCQEVGDLTDEEGALCQEVGDTIDEEDTAAVFEPEVAPHAQHQEVGDSIDEDLPTWGEVWGELPRRLATGTALIPFDGTAYGAEYMSFEAGAVVHFQHCWNVECGWAFGFTHTMAEGWFPMEYVMFPGIGRAISDFDGEESFEGCLSVSKGEWLILLPWTTPSDVWRKVCRLPQSDSAVMPTLPPSHGRVPHDLWQQWNGRLSSPDV